MPIFNFIFNKKLHFGELMHNLLFTCIHTYMNIINPAHVMKDNGDMSESSTHSLPLHMMNVSGQLHAPWVK
jgi:hypothetical protein